jgi:hypothetical protein
MGQYLLFAFLSHIIDDTAMNVVIPNMTFEVLPNMLVYNNDTLRENYQIY